MIVLIEYSVDLENHARKCWTASITPLVVLALYFLKRSVLQNKEAFWSQPYKRTCHVATL